MIKQFKLWNNIAGWAVFAVATISYLLTMEPTTSLWDCSEFIATSYKLEVGHPPGAPLFMMLARIASLLAPSPEYVPMMINAMNSVASGFCILFLFWTITHLSRRLFMRNDEEFTVERAMLTLGAGVVGALSYAYTDTFWFSAVEGEVYALSSMFTALVVWLMLKWEENADRATSMRWIILIAYLMGLSIGVHILNLLTIPALVMIYFFRRYDMRSPKEYFIKICVALLLSLLILGVINGLIIPYTVAAGAAVDTFAVNSLGMPVNSGMLLFIAAVSATLGYLVLFTHRRKMRLLNSIVLVITVILIGFASYASVTIRAMANPPMNSNNPSTPHMLLSMLNRDQYGNRPLLWGPYYSAQPLTTVDYNYYPAADYIDFAADADDYVPTETVDTKAMMWLNPETNEYEERVIFDNYQYPSEAMHFMPRMWNYARRDNYGSWVAMRDGHPTVERTSREGLAWWEPTRGEDVAYFMGYQMGDMFWRYFLWNFVGRQDDVQLQKDENGTYLHGGWLSGVEFIDELFCGPQDNLPADMAGNRARNTYFFLPLLLGLMGLIYQLNRDWRNWIVVMLLFVMMGIALVVYFNTSPNEPRERDYVYAGAFYAFSIWLGLGVLAIGDMLSLLVAKTKNRSRMLLCTAAVSVALGMSVPVVLAAENWDDHDRSGRYMARDLGWNYLQTAPHNAIIINYGDNDTFPLWYCQEVEGVRKDVRVMNSSYLGGEWYVDEMKLAANDAPAVPFTLPSTKYSFVNDWTLVANVVDVLDTSEARMLSRAKRYIENSGLYTISFKDGNGRTQTLSLTYAKCSSLLSDCAKSIDEIEPLLQSYIDEGSEPDKHFMELYAQLDEAYNLYDAIVSNKTFIEDYALIDRYYALNDSITAAELNLTDAIRLFVSDEPMTLVINDGRMCLLAEGEKIAPEQQSEDYRMVGKLRPTMDSYIDGAEVDYLLGASRYYIDVDKDAAIAAGIVSEEERDIMVDKVYIDIDKSVLSKDHLLMLDLFANFAWQRPLSFTQSHLMQDYGIVDYARFDGYCYTFVPIETAYSRGADVGMMNIDALYPLFMGQSVEGSIHQPLRYGNLADEDVYVDYFYRYNLSASRARDNFARVALGFARRNHDGDLAKAEALLDRGQQVLPPSNVEYTHSSAVGYVRGYYAIAMQHLYNATLFVEEAVAQLSTRLDVENNIADEGDAFAYFYALSDRAEELVATAEHRGVDIAEELRLLSYSDEEYVLAEDIFEKGDIYAAKYIKSRGEWVDHYLQFATREAFTPTISENLYNAAQDIIDILNMSESMAGSYAAVADMEGSSPLMPGQLSFDALVGRYVDAISRVTPTDVTDPRMDIMLAHIGLFVDVYETMPVRESVMRQIEEFCSRKEVSDALYAMYE